MRKRVLLTIYLTISIIAICVEPVEGTGMAKWLMYEVVAIINLAYAVLLANRHFKSDTHVN